MQQRTGQGPSFSLSFLHLVTLVRRNVQSTFLCSSPLLTAIGLRFYAFEHESE